MVEAAGVEPASLVISLATNYMLRWTRVFYGIVTAHHGCLDVESALGSGSTFSAYLPLAEANAAPSALVNSNDSFPGGSEPLLIIDDEDPLRELLAAAFTRKGYTVTTAASGLEAIDIIQDPARKFEAVLLDLNMPGAGGVDVLKIIRVCRPQTQVLVISGHITPEARRELEFLGQRDFIQKPYRLDDIGRRLRALLGSRKVG